MGSLINTNTSTSARSISKPRRKFRVGGKRRSGDGRDGPRMPFCPPDCTPPEVCYAGLCIIEVLPDTGDDPGDLA